MSNLNTSGWLAAKVRFVPRTFNVEGIPVEMIGLTDELKEDVQGCATSEDMFMAAADFGLSSNGVRVWEDDYLSEYLDELWTDESFMLDCDPSFKVKVGEKVCAISGLTQFVEDKKEEEKEKLKVGDHLIPGDADVESLDADAESYRPAA